MDSFGDESGAHLEKHFLIFSHRWAQIKHRFFMNTEHIEALKRGTFLMVGSGESYFAEIVQGADLLDKMMEAMYGETKQAPGDEREQYRREIENPDEWSSDSDWGPTHWWTDLGETDHMDIYLVTDKYSAGALLIAHERARQINMEGWTAKHDDEHSNGEMAAAAAAYIIHTKEARHLAGTVDYLNASPVDEWPWGEEWWKPKTPLADLIRAGALIAAEIDRLQRLANGQRRLSA